MSNQENKYNSIKDYLDHHKTQKLKIDLRKYFMLNRYYSFAGRLFFGNSTGKNPQKTKNGILIPMGIGQKKRKCRPTKKAVKHFAILTMMMSHWKTTSFHSTRMMTNH